MATRTVYLILQRNAASQRAHFAIWVPCATEPEKGTLINVVGAPMVGYELQFERNHCPAVTTQSHEIFPIGQVHSDHIADSLNDNQRVDYDPKGDLEIAAAQVPPPRISENFMAPVNDVSEITFGIDPSFADFTDHEQKMSRVDDGLYPPPSCQRLHWSGRNSNSSVEAGSSNPWYWPAACELALNSRSTRLSNGNCFYTVR